MYHVLGFPSTTEVKFLLFYLNLYNSLNELRYVIRRFIRCETFLFMQLTLKVAGSEVRRISPSTKMEFHPDHEELSDF